MQTTSQPRWGYLLQYNFSKDVSRTTAEAFKYVTLVGNFVAGSDSPFDMTKEQRRQALLSFYNDDRTPYFASSSRHKELLDKILTRQIINLRQKIISNSNLRVITDNNMLSEYKSMSSYINPQSSWLPLIEKIF